MNILVIYMYMYMAPGQGHTTPWAQNIFININLLYINWFLASFLSFIIFSYFSNSNAWATLVDIVVKKSRSFQDHDLYKLCSVSLPYSSCQVLES